MRLQPHHKDQIGPTLTDEEFGARHVGKTEYTRIVEDGEGWLVLVVGLDGSRHMYRTIDMKHWHLVPIGSTKEGEGA